MKAPKICLCLTGSTLAEDLTILNKYRQWIDMAELRADYLSDDERLYIRRVKKEGMCSGRKYVYA